MYGFSLQEIEGYAATLASEDAAISSAVEQKKGVYEKVLAEMETLAVKVRLVFLSMMTVSDLVTSSGELVHQADVI